MKLHKTKRSMLIDFFKSWAQYRAFYKCSVKERSIVFYSESGQDWHHFEPIISYLTTTLSKTVCYVTSDSTDPGLTIKHDTLHSFYLQEGYWQILFFQFLKADVLVLTMIDLNLFQLKRSINPVHYIYLFHAMGSTHMVDFENSYDHYDSIFCVGPHQIKEIRKREKLKKLPAKHLFEHGYARVERLHKQHQDFPERKSSKITVLLAPTWGEQSILPVCGERLIEALLNASMQVILRPHYQTVKLMPQVVNRLLALFGNNQDFIYLHRMGESESLFTSDILICDWSSMSLEYAIGLAKPVLYIDVPRRVRNPRYEELGIEPMEVFIRDQVGEIISPLQINQVPGAIRRLTENPKRFAEKIDTLRKTILYNFGNSVMAGAQEIARIAAEKEKPLVKTN